MGIAIILLGVVILFLVGLSLETLSYFSRQEGFMFALFKKEKAVKDPLWSQEEE